MRNSLLTICLLSAISLFGQYNNPYRITYDGTSYFVSNRGSGEIVKIDSAFNTSTVITGLTNPTEVLFGSFGGNSVLIVIANNVMKLYDPVTFNNFWNVNVPAVTEAHDAVYDPTNSNVFYLSDRAGNQIVKGVVGPPPFYPVTFSTVVTGIPKPAGMMIDNQGRFLVVSDVTNAQIYAIDTVTGGYNSVCNTGLDNLNDIVQDQQGNFYVTCWGDDKLYRYNENFSTSTSLAQYNNPSGMYVNTNYDYLAMCCHNCNKVEFTIFHLFSPLADVSVCVGDSFIVNFNPIYHGIGTYESDNKFIVELSDSSGVFSSTPLNIGQVSTDTVPNHFMAGVPPGNYASSGYQYRIKSTNPVVISYFTKNIVLNARPDATIYTSDSAELCVANSLQIGPGNDTSKTFDWSPGSYLSDSTSGLSTFQNAAPGEYDLHLMVTNKSTACNSESNLHITVVPNLSLPQLPASLQMCAGDTISVGVDNVVYRMNWTATAGLTDLMAGNPEYSGSLSKTLYVSFTDSAQTCSGNDSVLITVDTIPVIDFPGGYLEETCIHDMHTLIWDLNQGLEYSWSSDDVAINPSPDYRPIFTSGNAGTHSIMVEANDPSTGCTSESSFDLKSYLRPDSIRIYKNGTNLSLSDVSGVQSVQWSLNGELYKDFSGFDFPVDTLEAMIDTHKIFIEIFGYIVGDSGDTLCIESDTFTFHRDLSSIQNPNVIAYLSPNPVNELLTIKANFIINELVIYDIRGSIIQTINVPGLMLHQLDLSSLPSGVYWIRVQNKHQVSLGKIIKM